MSVDIEPAPSELKDETPSRSKMTECFRRNRNRINPEPIELPDCDFFNVAPRRTLRVLRPELKSGRFYEPQSSGDRRESINDNFYSRWARRPHPSGNCRCSFRQSANSSKLSSHEENIISQEIQRIRTSLCEAEKNGKDIDELEKSLAIDLAQLQVSTNVKQEADEKNSTDECSTAIGEQSDGRSRLEPFEDHVKQRIVQDLDRYISDLLDEILNDTIKAIAKADNPFNREKKELKAVVHERPTNFDISFAFHSSDEGEKVTNVKEKINKVANEGENGYINQAFVGSASDPDTLDFHIRHRLNGDAILENVDCIDSGINSVETIELQPEVEQNLEQSLIDIIDAKLGGASIGKSLEDLGMEADANENSKIPKAKESVVDEAQNQTIPEAKETAAAEVKKTTSEEKRVTIVETPVNSPEERTSKSLDEVIEEPNFNSLRLEIKRNSNSSKESDDKPSANVTSKVNKTVSVIRQRIATRLGNSRRKSTINEPSNKQNKTSNKLRRDSVRVSIELEDYRRRFPVPEPRPSAQLKCDEIRPLDEAADDEVTLRNRKPMIVFLHGFGSSADVFEHQLRYFANLGYPCIAPDLLGHGMSSAPSRSGDYQFDKLLQDLETVLLYYAFKPGQKCVLVAHNYGCSFATALASKYVGNVHQLVLISGGGPTPLAPPLSEGPAHCCLRASLSPLLVCGLQRGALYSVRGRQHPYCGPEEFENQWPSHMHYVLRGMSWPEGDYVFHRRICTPSLLVHGLRDKKVSLVQECQMERTMIKAFLEAIPAAGHMPMTECPEQLNHMIHCFIDLWKNKKW